jgi:hypothetical protein
LIICHAIRRSGISRSAGIPTGWEITLDLVGGTAPSLTQIHEKPFHD